MQRRVTIRDVAREAGVSIATVSNVLNRPGIVAAATRMRVQDAIDALEFVRTEGARQLHGLSAPVIAVMLPETAAPSGVELTRGVEQEATGLGLGVLIHSGRQEHAQPARYVNFLAAQRIHGVVLMAGDRIDHAAKALHERGLPSVIVDDHHPRDAACSLETDDAAGASDAVRHLLAQGHRTIAYVDGPASRRSQHRLQAVTQAYCATGATGAGSLTVRADALTCEAGRQAADGLLAGPRRPTAVLCADVALASGVLQALYEAGLRVPDDMAVVGFDDGVHGASAVVPLTTVQRPMAEMGRQAVRMLLRKTAAPLAHEHEHLVMRPELVVRGSSQRASTAVGR
ncbi:LacI family DNA-binding transcriptional regulator [Streptomyces sp. NPDC004629]|uniref:LacI family DNA-binding transcriptional regulator n=1 Tax=Streptomyces sp. NPDC004629 TaxID=3364705 RepID=UPI00367FA788